jgi:DNA repair exonuclease SbcCD nuclease subunit
MKVIHLSDLHLGWKDKKTNQSTIERFDRITKNLTVLFKPARKHIIVITGDLVNNANKPNLYQIALTKINKLKNAGFHVLVIPGNHDYGTGTSGNIKYVEKFKKTFYNNTMIEYPKIDIIGNILFLGLDSTAKELHWYDFFFANGELGTDQLNRLEKILNNHKYDKYKKIVYLHHHPFHPRPGHELKDSKKLKNIIKGKIDALLFGHNHNGYNLNNFWNIKRCYDGGSSTRKKNSQASIRVIDMEKDAKYDYIIEILSESEIKKRHT